MTTPMPFPPRISLSDAIAAPVPAGRLSPLMLEDGMLELRYYAPRGHDPQVPHDRDELYVVASGSGMFVRATERVAFGPGDVLVVPSGIVHRFEEFTEDFGTWVVFYGPARGGKP